MTVLVGLLCADGVVIGSDSSATLGDGGGTHTVEQPVQSKIEVVGSQVIVAGTGAVGLGQRFIEVVRKQHSKGLFSDKKGQVHAAKVLCNAARDDFLSTGAGQLVRQGAVEWQYYPYGALVAWCHGDVLVLVEFEVGNLQPEFKLANGIFYGSMGSGQAIADSFLGLMRRTLLADGPTNVATGKLIATWTIQHAIDINVGGIKGPVRLAALAPDGSAALVPEDELHDHENMVVEYEAHIGDYQAVAQGEKDAPELPTL